MTNLNESYIKIDDCIGELVREQRAEIYKRTGRPPIYLLIGRDIMQKLDIEIDVQMTLGVTFYGMKVVLVPLMNGIICLHDLEEKAP